jgi:hypothetical protein
MTLGLQPLAMHSYQVKLVLGLWISNDSIEIIAPKESQESRRIV